MSQLEPKTFLQSTISLASFSSAAFSTSPSFWGKSDIGSNAFYPFHAGIWLMSCERTKNSMAYTIKSTISEWKLSTTSSWFADFRFPFLEIDQVQKQKISRSCAKPWSIAWKRWKATSEGKLTAFQIVVKAAVWILALQTFKPATVSRFPPSPTRKQKGKCFVSDMAEVTFPLWHHRDRPPRHRCKDT